VDQVRVWLGEFASVSAVTGLVSDRDVTADDSFTVRARLRSGCDVVLQQSAGAWGPAAGLTRVAGDRATGWLDGGRAYVADASGTEELPVPADLVLPEPSPVDATAAHRFTHLELGPYTRLCEALRAGVEGRTVTAAVPVPTFADGLADMQVLDAIRASAAADGARVNV
jgi:predicted dehydrogenase